MPILARILLLAACGPLLLPPGLCVCAAGGPGHAPAGREAVAVAAHTCAHCPHSHTTPEGVGAGESHPAPHDDHTPGCPAASDGVSRAPRSEPPPDPTGGLVPAAFTRVVFAPLATVPRPAVDPDAPRSAAPPLYLSHCSLVI